VHLNRRAKIIIILAVIFSIFLLLLPHTSLFSNWVQNTSRRGFLIYSVIFMILGVVNGVMFYKSRLLKKRENNLIRIMLLIRHCLFLFLLSVATLIFLYIPMNPDVEFVMLLLILLCLPIAWVIVIIQLVKWIKSKKQVTSE
jgi:hypothetical protein